MSSTTHKCPNCGGLFTEAAQRFCAFCGIARPEPERATVVALAPNAPERFAAAERHPDLARLMALEPAPPNAGISQGCAALGPLIGCAACIGMAVFFDNMGAGWMTLVPAGMAVFCLVAFGAFLAKGIGSAKASLERRIALVVDERVLVSGSKGARTSYFATLESKDRERRELAVSADLAGRIAPNDLGIAYVQGDELADFRRLEV